MFSQACKCGVYCMSGEEAAIDGDDVMGMKTMKTDNPATAYLQPDTLPVGKDSR